MLVLGHNACSESSSYARSDSMTSKTVAMSDGWLTSQPRHGGRKSAPRSCFHPLLTSFSVSRWHAYVTREHLLCPLAREPDAERILAACGADLPALRRTLGMDLDESIERQRQGAE
jgi:hypothetical protein